MSILTQLSGLALKGAAHGVGHLAGVTALGGGVEAMVTALTQRFRDNSTRLTRALERSGGRAWRAVEIALAGRSWWDRCKLTLASGDDRAIRAEVQAYLDAHPLDGVDGHGPDFRGQCLVQLQNARKLGLLDRGVDTDELARRVGDLSRFADQAGYVEAERRAIDDIAARLRQHGYAALATFITLRPASGPPLLLGALRYFFQREVERDQELFQGLAYAKLDALADGQQSGFAGLADALEQHGDRLEGLLADVQAAVAQTHAAVLDVRQEVARQGQQIQDLGAAIFQALAQHQLERREVHGGDSLSIRDEGERRLVRDLVKRYRALPEAERKKMPAMLNAVGKLEVVAGDFESAERDFREVGRLVADGGAKAEAAHNAYRAALERRAWGDALVAFQDAVRLDAGRFAPFPFEKFEPERILGAGGFGVAFLCRNRHSGGRVVIKTLRRDGLDRDLSDIFREAQALEELEHPAVIRIRDCDYADAGHARPYFVMDYFPGQTLAEYVEQHGVVSPDEAVRLARLVAGGLQRAHAKGILHRDIKPQNLLVRRGADGWEAKLIDFGLALRAQASPSTAQAALDRTLAGASIAGTLEYGAPEQMGKLKGVAVGPYTDVYGFGKTCCYALFGTAQPTYQHWQKLPRELADLLGRCLAEQPRERPQDFAAVLRELEPSAAVPVVAPVPVMAARAIMDVEVLEEVAPKPRPRPVLREREEPVRRRKGGYGGMLLLVGLIVGCAVVGTALLLMMSRSASPPPRPPVQGPVTSGVTAQGPPAAQPIPEAEFKQVLAELQGKPTAARLKALGERLAVTEPTKGQRDARDRVRALTALGKAGNEKALAEARERNEIWQISCALEPLLKAKTLDYQLAGATACERWGSSENVQELIGLLSADGYGADKVRISAAKALAHIGDPRGIAPAAKRLDDPWDTGHGLIEAMVAFGPAAEKEVLAHLDNPKSRGPAIAVLKQIGTKDSLPKLEALKGNRDAAAAAAAIRARGK